MRSSPRWILVLCINFLRIFGHEWSLRHCWDPVHLTSNWCEIQLIRCCTIWFLNLIIFAICWAICHLFLLLLFFIIIICLFLWLFLSRFFITHFIAQGALNDEQKCHEEDEAQRVEKHWLLVVQVIIIILIIGAVQWVSGIKFWDDALNPYLFNRDCYHGHLTIRFAWTASYWTTRRLTSGSRHIFITFHLRIDTELRLMF